MSSTKSLGKAVDSNWMVSPLSIEVEAMAVGWLETGGMSCSALSSA